ncbi:hypothetical protein [Neisseria sp.]|uniref:hypothetical protein n=1 Tax=Neisseria sp. TaxID=192066 RepID=UPI0035A160DD
MTNSVDQTIPAKRYFTLDEVCQLVQINPAQFVRWQHENGAVIGYGGEHYTRLDVVKLMKLKDSFAPYVDGFNYNLNDAEGNPAADAEEVRAGLENILSDIEKALANPA